jgi:hypothetical protein
VGTSVEKQGASKVMTASSPLRSKPLRNPGQGLDEELQDLWYDKALSYYFMTSLVIILAGLEWFAYLRHLPRQPIALTIVAVVFATFSTFRLWQLKRKSKRLKLGRDGERAVGQFLEGLRVTGARIFHDVPAEGFNLDHVVIAPQGIYVVETKTWSKPFPKAQVTFDGEGVLVNGRPPDRNPVVQVRAEVDWLRRNLEGSTGKRLPIRGVIVFPGWWVAPMTAETRSEVWVLEPKALPGFIEHEPRVLPDSDVALAAYHLGRYVRTKGT